MGILVLDERYDDILEAQRHVWEKELLLDPSGFGRSENIGLEDIWYNQDIEFKCLLDRNVVSYLIDLVKGAALSSQSNYRSVAALQAVLSAGGVISETGYSYHEYIEKNGIEKADKELALFRSADNLSRTIYLDLFLQKLDSIPSANVPFFPDGELRDSELPSKLFIVESNLTILKKAISISSKHSSGYKALLEVMDWIHDEYIFSMPNFQFLSIYFSQARISKMLKSRDIIGLRNASWDVSFVQQLIKNQKADKSAYWLFSTFDRAVKTTVDLTFPRHNETKDTYLARLEESYASMWGKKNGYGVKLIRKLENFQKTESEEKRKRNSVFEDKDYHEKLRTRVDMEFKSINC